MAEKRVMFMNDYNKRRGPSYGSGQFTYNNTGIRNQTEGHNRCTTVDLRWRYTIPPTK